MADTYTEVTRNGYFGRIKNSIGGFFIGFIFVIGAIILLWFNEHRSIARHIGLQQAAGSVVSVRADMLGESHEGKLVHTSGMTQAAGTLKDNVYNVSTDGLKLRRKVEMYQWEESESESSKDNLGGSETVTTTYSYDKRWSENPISSANFKIPEGHQNPSFEEPRSHTQVQADISIENLRLNDAFVSQINGYQALSLDMETLGLQSATGTLQVSPREIYYGANSATPQVGDKRVRFEVVSPSMISVMGEYNAGKLITHTTENESTISLLENGDVSAEEMILSAERTNTLITWGLRVLGIFLLYAGFSMILAPLVIIAKVIPFVSRIVGFGTGIIAFLLAMIVGPLVIAIAWFAARPLVSGIVLAVAGLIIGAILYMKKQKKAPQAPDISEAK